MNTLFSSMDILKQYQCLSESLSHTPVHSSLYIFKYIEHSFGCQDFTIQSGYIQMAIMKYLQANLLALHSNLVIFK